MTSPWQPNGRPAGVKPPFHPRLVLLVAALLPGVGQIMNNQAGRGLLFAFTAVALGYVTSKYAAPDASIVGRYAGGFFIHAIALMDAYRWAKVRWELFHYDPEKRPTDPKPRE